MASWAGARGCMRKLAAPTALLWAGWLNWFFNTSLRCCNWMRPQLLKSSGAIINGAGGEKGRSFCGLLSRLIRILSCRQGVPFPRSVNPGIWLGQNLLPASSKSTLLCAGADEDDGDRAPENFEVEPERPVVDVFQIQTDP